MDSNYSLGYGCDCVNISNYRSPEDSETCLTNTEDILNLSSGTGYSVIRNSFFGCQRVSWQERRDRRVAGVKGRKNILPKKKIHNFLKELRQQRAPQKLFTII